MAGRNADLLGIASGFLALVMAVQSWAASESPKNVAALANGATIAGPRNCSGSRGKPPAAIDGQVAGYGGSVGYMWAYLKTPLVVTFKEPALISGVELLLLDVTPRDYGYVVETSLDGKEWAAAADRSKARDKGWQLRRFERRRAAMLRVRFTRTSVSAGSYHVVEIAAYDLPEDMATSPLRKRWEAEHARHRERVVSLLGVDDAQKLLADGAFLSAARALKKGQVLLRDLDGDGDPDALTYRDARAIVVVLDDNDDMGWRDTAADCRDDCLAVDLGADGRVDRSVDFMDADRNGQPDVMVQAYATGSPWGRQALVLIVDHDQRGPKRLWWLTPDYGYSQGLCQWKCDFGGDGYFVMFTRDTRRNQWVGAFENPFCFYDPDGDGLAEETVRISGRGRRLRSARYGVNADNDATEGHDYDYDVSVTALGSVEPPDAAFTRFKLRTGEMTGEYLKWDTTRQTVRTLPWKRALLVWDENDHNVAVRGGRNERWEGIINSRYRGFPQEGGPPCGTVNKRYELDADLSGKMRLYYWPADRRIHLFGAEQGTLTVDFDYDGKTDLAIEYRDTDGDGFFDQREVTTRRPKQTRTLAEAKPPTGTMALDYREITKVWPDALKDTLAAQRELLAALAKLSGRACLPSGPIEFYEKATEKQFRYVRRMRQSQEARRYYQDVEVELAFATLVESKLPAAARKRVEQARGLADQGLLREASAILNGETVDVKVEPIAMRNAERADPEESQGIWYTAGTAKGYGRSRPDKSYPAEKYACVYPGKDTVYSGAMATYCAWHRPMAIYVPSQDKTFLVFGNPRNYPTISAYDHRSKSFAAPVVLDTNPNTDAHRNPTLLLDQEGFLYVFYGAHGHPSRIAKSVKPYDITRWVKAAPIEEKNTYPQPWMLKPRELFVSYRAAPGWCYRKSTDGAESWQAAVPLIAFRGKAIYAVSIAETGGYPRKIHIAWSKMGGGTPDEVRTKALWARRYNVYYARSDDGGTTWKRSDGTPYTLPITEAAAEKVHDCGTHGVWLKDIQLDPQGNPCILFLDANVRTYETTWKFARCTDGTWRIADVAVGDHMYDAGGIVVLGEDDIRIYGPTTSSQAHEDGGEIEEWTSADQGATWRNTKHLTANSPYSHNHVKVVWNGGKRDFRFMWCYGDSAYPPATKKVTLYYHGEGQPGPQRMRFPASCLQKPLLAR